MERITISVTPKMAEVLNKWTANGVSKTEILRRALGLYELLKNEVEEHHARVKLVDDKNQERELIFTDMFS